MATRKTVWIEETANGPKEFASKAAAEAYLKGDNLKAYFAKAMEPAANGHDVGVMAEALVTHINSDAATFAAVAKPVFPKILRPRKNTAKTTRGKK